MGANINIANTSPCRNQRGASRVESSRVESSRVESSRAEPIRVESSANKQWLLLLPQSFGFSLGRNFILAVWAHLNGASWAKWAKPTADGTPHSGGHPLPAPGLRLLARKAAATFASKSDQLFARLAASNYCQKLLASLWPSPSLRRASFKLFDSI